MSIDLAEAALLVKAFGGEVGSLPPKPSLDRAGLVTAYLEAVKVAVDAAGSEVEVEVSGGWVNSGGVKGMALPVGIGYFKLIDINPKNDQDLPEARDGQYGPFFFATFELLAGEGGAQTPFVGVTVTEIVNYAIQVKVGEDGVPVIGWAMTDVGKKWTNASVIMSNLIRLTAPSMIAQGEMQYTDPYNVLPDWLVAAQRDEAPIKFYRAKDKKGRIKANFATLESGASLKVAPTLGVPVEAPAAAVPTPTSSAPDEAEMQKKGLVIFKTFMDLVAGASAFAEGTLKPTDAGRVALRTHISPLKEQGIAKHGQLAKLTIDEVTKIVQTVREKLKGDARKKANEMFEQLGKIGLGFDNDDF
jgi:hypothetical protein